MSDTTTTSALTQLTDYVTRATTVYRKGDVVKADAGVITVDAFPAMPEGATTVDCHFVTVGFTEALVELTHREFYDLTVRAATEGAYGLPLSVDTLAKGPSFITLGGWLGDQTVAFRFMAACRAHGIGSVVTPAELGFPQGQMADEMAGQGYVLLGGFVEPQEDA